MMERLFKFSLLIGLFILGFISCKDSHDEENIDNQEKQYILEATVTNKAGATAEIDHAARLILVKNVKRKDGWQDVRIKLVLAQFVYMVSPATEEAVYDLTKNAEVKVRYGAAGGSEIVYTIDLEETEEDDIDPESEGWVQTTEFGSLPEGMTVYRSPDVLADKKVKACIVVADILKGRKFRVLGGSDGEGLKTPDQFYDEQKSPVIINGSYFYSTWNVGLLVRNGTAIRAANSQEVTRKGPGGKDVIYYPTRGVFSYTKEGKYQVDWVYTVSQVIYGYPEPSPIVIGQEPPPRPSATFPAGAVELQLQDAIGAGPVLIKDFQIRNTWQEEIWDDEGGILPNGNHPRTAVGITETWKIIYFVCEGRQATAGVAGLSTADVAAILSDLGCKDALNLDGGGSTCMLVNGKQSVKTSNMNGTQRAVATVLILE
jgi:hypothetical protein